jgi:pilus assembly protein Flp/PilA
MIVDKFRARMNRFIADDRGATAIEYGLILVLLSMVVVVAVETIGTRLAALFERVAALFA